MNRVAQAILRRKTRIIGLDVPKQALWLPEYLLELTTFPKGKYDDQVDSTSQALAWFKTGMWSDGMGVFLWTKQEAEKRRQGG